MRAVLNLVFFVLVHEMSQGADAPNKDHGLPKNHNPTLGEFLKWPGGQGMHPPYTNSGATSPFLAVDPKRKAAAQDLRAAAAHNKDAFIQACRFLEKPGSLADEGAVRAFFGHSYVSAFQWSISPGAREWTRSKDRFFDRLHTDFEKATQGISEALSNLSDEGFQPIDVEILSHPTFLEAQLEQSAQILLKLTEHLQKKGELLPPFILELVHNDPGSNLSRLRQIKGKIKNLHPNRVRFRNWLMQQYDQSKDRSVKAAAKSLFFQGDSFHRDPIRKCGHFEELSAKLIEEEIEARKRKDLPPEFNEDFQGLFDHHCADLSSETRTRFLNLKDASAYAKIFLVYSKSEKFRCHLLENPPESVTEVLEALIPEVDSGNSKIAGDQEIRQLVQAAGVLMLPGSTPRSFVHLERELSASHVSPDLEQKLKNRLQELSDRMAASASSGKQPLQLARDFASVKLAQALTRRLLGHATAWPGGEGARPNFISSGKQSPFISVEEVKQRGLPTGVENALEQNNKRLSEACQKLSQKLPKKPTEAYDLLAPYFGQSYAYRVHDSADGTDVRNHFLTKIFEDYRHSTESALKVSDSPLLRAELSVNLDWFDAWKSPSSDLCRRTLAEVAKEIYGVESAEKPQLPKALESLLREVAQEKPFSVESKNFLKSPAFRNWLLQRYGQEPLRSPLRISLASLFLLIDERGTLPGDSRLLCSNPLLEATSRIGKEILARQRLSPTTPGYADMLAYLDEWGVSSENRVTFLRDPKKIAIAPLAKALRVGPEDLQNVFKALPTLRPFEAVSALPSLDFLIKRVNNSGIVVRNPIFDTINLNQQLNSPEGLGALKHAVKSQRDQLEKAHDREEERKVARAVLGYVDSLINAHMPKANAFPTEESPFVNVRNFSPKHLPNLIYDLQERNKKIFEEACKKINEIGDAADKHDRLEKTFGKRWVDRNWWDKTRELRTEFLSASETNEFTEPWVKFSARRNPHSLRGNLAVLGDWANSTNERIVWRTAIDLVEFLKQSGSEIPAPLKSLVPKWNADDLRGQKENYRTLSSLSREERDGLNHWLIGAYQSQTEALRQRAANLYFLAHYDTSLTRYACEDISKFARDLIEKDKGLLNTAKTNARLREQLASLFMECPHLSSGKKEEFLNNPEVAERAAVFNEVKRLGKFECKLLELPDYHLEQAFDILREGYKTGKLDPTRLAGVLNVSQFEGQEKNIRSAIDLLSRGYDHEKTAAEKTRRGKLRFVLELLSDPEIKRKGAISFPGFEKSAYKDNVALLKTACAKIAALSDAELAEYFGKDFLAPEDKPLKERLRKKLFSDFLSTTQANSRFKTSLATEDRLFSDGVLASFHALGGKKEPPFTSFALTQIFDQLKNRTQFTPKRVQGLFQQIEKEQNLNVLTPAEVSGLRDWLQNAYNQWGTDPNAFVPPTPKSLRSAILDALALLDDLSSGKIGPNYCGEERTQRKLYLAGPPKDLPQLRAALSEACPLHGVHWKLERLPGAHLQTLLLLKNAPELKQVRNLENLQFLDCAEMGRLRAQEVIDGALRALPLLSSETRSRLLFSLEDILRLDLDPAGNPDTWLEIMLALEKRGGPAAALARKLLYAKERVPGGLGIKGVDWSDTPFARIPATFLSGKNILRASSPDDLESVLKTLTAILKIEGGKAVANLPRIRIERMKEGDRVESLKRLEALRRELSESDKKNLGAVLAALQKELEKKHAYFASGGFSDHTDGVDRFRLYENIKANREKIEIWISLLENPDLTYGDIKKDKSLSDLLTEKTGAESLQGKADNEKLSPSLRKNFEKTVTDFHSHLEDLARGAHEELKAREERELGAHDELVADWKKVSAEAVTYKQLEEKFPTIHAFLKETIKGKKPEELLTPRDKQEIDAALGARSHELKNREELKPFDRFQNNLRLAFQDYQRSNANPGQQSAFFEHLRYLGAPIPKNPFERDPRSLVSFAEALEGKGKPSEEQVLQLNALRIWSLLTKNPAPILKPQVDMASAIVFSLFQNLARKKGNHDDSFVGPVTVLETSIHEIQKKYPPRETRNLIGGYFLNHSDEKKDLTRVPKSWDSELAFQELAPLLEAEPDSFKLLIQLLQFPDSVALHSFVKALLNKDLTLISKRFPFLFDLKRGSKERALLYQTVVRDILERAPPSRSTKDFLEESRQDPTIRMLLALLGFSGTTTYTEDGISDNGIKEFVFRFSTELDLIRTLSPSKRNHFFAGVTTEPFPSQNVRLALLTSKLWPEETFAILKRSKASSGSVSKGLGKADVPVASGKDRGPTSDPLGEKRENGIDGEHKGDYSANEIGNAYPIAQLVQIAQRNPAAFRKLMWEIDDNETFKKSALRFLDRWVAPFVGHIFKAPDSSLQRAEDAYRLNVGFSYYTAETYPDRVGKSPETLALAIRNRNSHLSDQARKRLLKVLSPHHPESEDSMTNKELIERFEEFVTLKGESLKSRWTRMFPARLKTREDREKFLQSRASLEDRKYVASLLYADELRKTFEDSKPPISIATRDAPRTLPPAMTPGEIAIYRDQIAHILSQKELSPEDKRRAAEQAEFTLIVQTSDSQFLTLKRILEEKENLNLSATQFHDYMNQRLTELKRDIPWFHQRLEGTHGERALVATDPNRAKLFQSIIASKEGELELVAEQLFGERCGLKDPRLPNGPGETITIGKKLSCKVSYPGWNPPLPEIFDLEFKFSLPNSIKSNDPHLPQRLSEWMKEDGNRFEKAEKAVAKCRKDPFTNGHMRGVTFVQHTECFAQMADPSLRADALLYLVYKANEPGFVALGPGFPDHKREINEQAALVFGFDDDTRHFRIHRKSRNLRSADLDLLCNRASEVTFGEGKDAVSFNPGGSLAKDYLEKYDKDPALLAKHRSLTSMLPPQHPVAQYFWSRSFPPWARSLFDDTDEKTKALMEQVRLSPVRACLAFWALEGSADVGTLEKNRTALQAVLNRFKAGLPDEANPEKSDPNPTYAKLEKEIFGWLDQLLTAKTDLEREALGEEPNLDALLRGNAIGLTEQRVRNLPQVRRKLLEQLQHTVNAENSFEKKKPAIPGEIANALDKLIASRRLTSHEEALSLYRGMIETLLRQADREIAKGDHDHTYLVVNSFHKSPADPNEPCDHSFDQELLAENSGRDFSMMEHFLGHCQDAKALNYRPSLFDLAERSDKKGGISEGFRYSENILSQVAGARSELGITGASRLALQKLTPVAYDALLFLIFRNTTRVYGHCVLMDDKAVRKYGPPGAKASEINKETLAKLILNPSPGAIFKEIWSNENLRKEYLDFVMPEVAEAEARQLPSVKDETLFKQVEQLVNEQNGIMKNLKRFMGGEALKSFFDGVPDGLADRAKHVIAALKAEIYHQAFVQMETGQNEFYRYLGQDGSIDEFLESLDKTLYDPAIGTKSITFWKLLPKDPTQEQIMSMKNEIMFGFRQNKDIARILLGYQDSLKRSLEETRRNTGLNNRRLNLNQKAKLLGEADSNSSLAPALKKIKAMLLRAHELSVDEKQALRQQAEFYLAHDGNLNPNDPLTKVLTIATNLPEDIHRRDAILMRCEERLANRYAPGAVYADLQRRRGVVSSPSRQAAVSERPKSQASSPPPSEVASATSGSTPSTSSPVSKESRDRSRYYQDYLERRGGTGPKVDSTLPTGWEKDFSDILVRGSMVSARSHEPRELLKKMILRNGTASDPAKRNKPFSKQDWDKFNRAVADTIAGTYGKPLSHALPDTWKRDFYSTLSQTELGRLLAALQGDISDNHDRRLQEKNRRFEPVLAAIFDPSGKHELDSNWHTKLGLGLDEKQVDLVDRYVQFMSTKFDTLQAKVTRAIAELSDRTQGFAIPADWQDRVTKLSDEDWDHLRYLENLLTKYLPSIGAVHTVQAFDSLLMNLDPQSIQQYLRQFSPAYARHYATEHQVSKDREALKAFFKQRALTQYREQTSDGRVSLAAAPDAIWDQFEGVSKLTMMRNHLEFIEQMRVGTDPDLQAQRIEGFVTRYFKGEFNLQGPQLREAYKDFKTRYLAANSADQEEIADRQRFLFHMLQLERDLRAESVAEILKSEPSFPKVELKESDFLTLNPRLRDNRTRLAKTILSMLDIPSDPSHFSQPSDVAEEEFDSEPAQEKQNSFPMIERLLDSHGSRSWKNTSQTKHERQAILETIAEGRLRTRYCDRSANNPIHALFEKAWSEWEKRNAEDARKASEVHRSIRDCMDGFTKEKRAAQKEAKLQHGKSTHELLRALKGIRQLNEAIENLEGAIFFLAEPGSPAFEEAYRHRFRGEIEREEAGRRERGDISPVEIPKRYEHIAKEKQTPRNSAEIEALRARGKPDDREKQLKKNLELVGRLKRQLAAHIKNRDLWGGIAEKDQVALGKLSQVWSDTELQARSACLKEDRERRTKTGSEAMPTVANMVEWALEQKRNEVLPQGSPPEDRRRYLVTQNVLRRELQNSFDLKMRGRELAKLKARAENGNIENDRPFRQWVREIENQCGMKETLVADFEKTRRDYELQFKNEMRDNKKLLDRVQKKYGITYNGRMVNILNADYSKGTPEEIRADLNALSAFEKRVSTLSKGSNVSDLTASFNIEPESDIWENIRDVAFDEGIRRGLIQEDPKLEAAWFMLNAKTAVSIRKKANGDYEYKFASLEEKQAELQALVTRIGLEIGSHGRLYEEYRKHEDQWGLWKGVNWLKQKASGKETAQEEKAWNRHQESVGKLIAKLDAFGALTPEDRLTQARDLKDFYHLQTTERFLMDGDYLQRDIFQDAHGRSVKLMATAAAVPAAILVPGAGWGYLGGVITGFASGVVFHTVVSEGWQAASHHVLGVGEAPAVGRNVEEMWWTGAEFGGAAALGLPILKVAARAAPYSKWAAKLSPGVARRIPSATKVSHGAGFGLSGTALTGYRGWSEGKGRGENFFASLEHGARMMMYGVLPAQGIWGGATFAAFDAAQTTFDYYTNRDIREQRISSGKYLLGSPFLGELGDRAVGSLGIYLDVTWKGRKQQPIINFAKDVSRVFEKKGTPGETRAALDRIYKDYAAKYEELRGKRGLYYVVHEMGYPRANELLHSNPVFAEQIAEIVSSLDGRVISPEKLTKAWDEYYSENPGRGLTDPKAWIDDSPSFVRRNMPIDGEVLKKIAAKVPRVTALYKYDPKFAEEQLKRMEREYAARGPISTDVDYYKYFEGIDPSAPHDELKARYRKGAMKYHPDRNLSDPIAEQIFKDIAGAWEVLGDPATRRRYNEKMGFPPPRN